MRKVSWLAPLLGFFATSAFGAHYFVGIGDGCAAGARCFAPTPLAIKVGDSVSFYPYDENAFTGPRNVVADDGSFRCAKGCDGRGGDGSPRDEWQFTRTFDAPGTIDYHDEVSGAKGVIVVEESNAAPPKPTGIEYHYQTYYHSYPADDFIWSYVGSYFVTANPDEIAALDTGGVWWRTGESFRVWSQPESGTLPTCRFFDSAVGAHFLTPYVAECSALQADPRWTYEGTAFHLQVPDGNGQCPIGATILYRLYNRGTQRPPCCSFVWHNTHLHRYTTSLSTFGDMGANGWTFEGHGETFAFACVPNP